LGIFDADEFLPAFFSCNLPEKTTEFTQSWGRNPDAKSG